MKKWQSKLGVLVFISTGFSAFAENNPGDVTALTSSKTTNEFIVFDGTLYRNKPSLTQYGIKPMYITYKAEFWKPEEDTNELPSETRVREIARKAKVSKLVTVLDIEEWGLQGEENKVTENLTKYLTVLKWFRDAAPDILVGYFARAPIPDYWRAIKDPSTPMYLSWQAENNRLESLACQVDALFPHMYTALDDREGWTKAIIANIQEARRYPCKKPVYVFLWPQYSENNRLKNYQYFPPDYWKLQLEIARQYADGIVIWGGWSFDKTTHAQWDDNAPWWQVTKKFMEELNRQ